MKVLINELKRSSYETLTYCPDFFVSIFIYFVIFFLFINGNKNSENNQINFFFWIITSGILSEASISISTEKQMGTLKNLLLKPCSILYIMTSRTLAWAIINILKIFIIIFILKFILPIKIVMSPSIFFVLCLSMVGVYGLSLILMALTMIYTKTASFGVVIEYTLLFLSGLIFPIEKMPLILKIISKFSPLYLGVNITNKIYENQFYFTDLYPLAVQSCCYLFLGYILFKIIIKFNYNYSMRY